MTAQRVSFGKEKASLPIHALQFSLNADTVRRPCANKRTARGDVEIEANTWDWVSICLVGQGRIDIPSKTGT